MGEFLDHEKLDTRVAYFRRIKELMGAPDGPRGDEARARLEIIAQTRQINIQTIITEETVKINSRANKCYNIFKGFSRNSKPKIIFEATECPVCQDDQVVLCSMSCGHKICNECYNLMKTKSILVDMYDRVKCPCCRKPSENLFHV
jgi:hypothetical protein